MLAPPAKAYFAKRVCVIGVESSGTTTLAQSLAQHYQTVWVPEYGRWYWEGKRYTPGAEQWDTYEFVQIAKGQTNWEDDLAMRANRLLICDTDPLATHLWYRRYTGTYSNVQVADSRHYDLYTLTTPDFAFVQDGTREGEHIRLEVHQWVIEVLKQKGKRYTTVKGSYEQRRLMRSPRSILSWCSPSWIPHKIVALSRGNPMCDTFVALPDATLDGSVIFGKNSDRPEGEIQDVVTFPAQTHSRGQSVQCTYIQIPQIERTYAVILSKPRWMWGAEMGANECGVVLGNEAVWTTGAYQSIGLLGMDLVRLGLERGETAFATLQVIIDLLEQYGQGGNCAEHFSFTYHNSFLIADYKEAWILETAGKYWVAERVTQGTRSISNNLSIRSAGDLRHPDVVRAAVAQGRCRGEADFDFAKFFSDGGVEDPLSP